MRIDIIHMRDPDSASDHEVYLDGVRIGDAIDLNFYEFDPGAGYEMDAFEGNKQSAVDAAPEFLKARISELYDEFKPTYERWSL
jgi:hypothetical protein